MITKKNIRKKLCEVCVGRSANLAQNAYKWVIDAPFWEWDDRLWCVCNTIGWAGEMGNEKTWNAVYSFAIKGALLKE